MKFGQYELLEPIAIGGMAEVFKGRVVGAEGFEKLVAIKRILPDLAADDRFVNMLLTEARIHSALSHRNIVQIHDLGISESGEYFIVLEYVEGYDLRVITEQLAADGEIVPEALSLYIAAEVAEGLHFAHEMRGPDGQPLGLVHRDVTPSNVLISFSGEVKLSDFGLAKRRHDRSVVGTLKGNLAYMSPEQAKQGTLDRRTDIFSLGALLFELLTGKRLREITDELAAWSQVASGVVPSIRRFRPDLPPAIGRLLDMALAPDPARRFSDAAAFGAAIRDALTSLNVPVGASDLAALLSIVKPPRRSRSIMLETSKVIRLGDEARALREAISAPITPAPIAMSGTIQPARNATAQPRGGVDDPEATPPPGAPRRREGHGTRPTPSPTTPLPPRDSGLGPAASAARESARGFSATPVRMNAVATPVPSVRRPPAPTPSRGIPQVPVANARPPAPTAPRPPAQQTAPQGFAIATPPLGSTAAGRQTGPRGFALPALPISPENARPARLPARSGGRTLLILLVLVGAAAAGVHFFVMPLDVLVAWRKPARLFIATEPSGATLRLDGKALDETSPAAIEVPRDRREHLVEAQKGGFQRARQTVRYDRAVRLTVHLALEPDGSPPGPSNGRPRKANSTSTGGRHPPASPAP